MEIIENGKLRVKDRTLLALVEEFMNCPQGHLSEFVTWNDVMPVVEKINATKLKDNEFPASVTIYRTTCHINDDMDVIFETSGKDRLIECVWIAVVRFIEWYNLNLTPCATQTEGDQQ